jgi:hypothetical protein
MSESKLERILKKVGKCTLEATLIGGLLISGHYLFDPEGVKHALTYETGTVALGLACSYIFLRMDGAGLFDYSKKK